MGGYLAYKFDFELNITALGAVDSTLSVIVSQEIKTVNFLQGLIKLKMSDENQLRDSYREMLDQFLRSIPAFPEHRFQGRGIVLCGGGTVYFPCIWVCIRMLRNFGCTLPIELWYRGPREMTDEMKALLEPYDVVCRDSFAVAREFPVRRLDGWELKPYAILNSRFAEVLYIDADNVVVRNPEFLFDTVLYADTGALFWQDLPNDTSGLSYLKDNAWDLLGLPFRDEPPFESGQLLVDKRRCWRPLQLTLHLNEHSDYYYTAFFGDKDTFHLAWRKIEQQYSLNPHVPGVLSAQRALVQFDPDGKRLFQHRCNAKWTITERNLRIPGFLYEEECLALLQELQDRWSPDSCVFSYTPVEQAAFDEIVRRQTFRDESDGGVWTFQSDLTVSFNGEPFNWQVEEEKDGTAVLLILDSDRRLSFLRKTPPGNWAGRWRYGDRSFLELSQ